MSAPNSDLSSLWTQHRDALNALLLDVKNNGPKMAAMYLYGHSPSGLSTSLVSHVVGQAKRGLAPQCVIYVTYGGTVASKIKEWAQGQGGLAAEIGENDFTSLLTVMEASQFVYQAMTRPTEMRSVVLMVDIRTAATVEDEIFFIYLLKVLIANHRRGQDSGDLHLALLLLGGSWLSPRTVRTISKVMTVSPKQITRPSAHVFACIGPSWDGKTKAMADGAIKKLLDKRRRVFIRVHESWDQDLVDDLPSLRCIQRVKGDDPEGDILLLRDAPAVSLTPGISFSIPTNLDAFFSFGEMWAVVRDENMGQLVRVIRQRTRCELDEDAAWVLKAKGFAGSRCRLFTSYTQEDYDSRPEGNDGLGPAWNEDIMYLGLKVIAIFPETPLASIPMRFPPSDAAWLDTLRRLRVLGCVTQSLGKPAYELTVRGKATVRLMEDDLHIGFSTASLVCSAGGGGLQTDLDEPSRMVLIILATIDYYGWEEYLTLADGSEVIENLSQHCAPVVRAQADRGIMWFTTGIFLEHSLRLMAPLEEGIEVRELSGGISFDVQVGSTMMQVASVLSKWCPGLPVQSHQWTRTPLSDAQVASIDEALMWAFIHKTVYFPPDAGFRPPVVPELTELEHIAKEVVSMRDVRAYQPDELLNIDEWRAHSLRTSPRGGFTAMYRDLTLFDGAYTVSGLTWLAPATLRLLEQRCGVAWPEAVVRWGD
ncbi:hypothetical protein GGR56DRAFT_624277 [Xylariaceae sp. FL0804]|nr:hypothetical protein GGR56DRAFT_624277 [Xylariaceae sp. FL0804]